MKLELALAAIFVCFTLVHGYIVNPGPKYPPTKGEVWPRPRNQIKNESYFVLEPPAFKIKVTSNSVNCALLKGAITRYELIISSVYEIVQKALNSSKRSGHEKTWLNNVEFLGNIEYLNIFLNGPCSDLDYPTDTSFESYTLTISENTKMLNSTSIWGILRGLESFYQSLYPASNYLSLRINKTFIDDYPRFSYRGLLLDTSRHYIPLDKILLTIDAMSQNKLNVFHWHIVDDQSFPYVSKKFPELSEKGAYTPFYVYTPETIAIVIEYARLRGIRVIPEFDTPGHTRSWGVSHPELLSNCGSTTGIYGPINPIRNETYTFINELFTEVKGVFPDKYIHLGGDEVEFDCWKNDPTISDFMKQHDISNYKSLESYYIQKIINLANNLNYKSIVWEEVFRNGVKIPKETVVHVWTDNWVPTMTDVTMSNYSAILSACWYLDHLDSNGDWLKFYECEPYSFSDNPILQSRIVGGEACMWSEVVDQNNVISRVWPRASAVAEKLWYVQDDYTNLDEVRRRLEEHTCRMNRRGIGAQPPNAAGFCVL